MRLSFSSSVVMPRPDPDPVGVWQVDGSENTQGVFKVAVSRS
jgi:hypothetical protein